MKLDCCLFWEILRPIWYKIFQKNYRITSIQYKKKIDNLSSSYIIIMSYYNYISLVIIVPTLVNGWQIVEDVCNCFGIYFDK